METQVRIRPRMRREDVNLFFVNLPHTETNKDYIACAYTQKLVKLAPQMKKLGYKVHIIGGENNETDCDFYHTAVSTETRLKWFGDQDFHSEFFNITWGPNDTHWVEMNNNAIEYIKPRIKQGDIICLIAGVCQQQIANAFPSHFNVEYGIGYHGVFSPYKVFESYAHMHYCYGAKQDDNGYYYDNVIHNYFDPEEFDFGLGEGEYLLWMGRFIHRKGPEIAVEVARRLGLPLKMAGQGAYQDGNKVCANEGPFFLEGDHIEHVGHVDAKQRSDLMKNALVTLMPTTYLEPFGGVSIESMMCGTPVVASDFGAFSETVHPPVGYRFRTIGEAVAATEDAMLLNRSEVRDHAVAFYNSERAAKLYDEYFQQLHTLYEAGNTLDGHRRDGFYSDWRPEERRFING